MKKIYFMLIALMAIFCVSCDGDTQPTNDQTQNQPTIQWNLTATAVGEGLVEVGFPTGSIRADGTAEVMFKTSNDSVSLRSVNFVECDEVLDNPLTYSKDEIKAAKEVQNSIIYVKELEGTWKVDIVGYAKYGTLYILIDEHFPKEVEAPDQDIENDTVQ